MNNKKEDDKVYQDYQIDLGIFLKKVVKEEEWGIKRMIKEMKRKGWRLTLKRKKE